MPACQHKRAQGQSGHPAVTGSHRLPGIEVSGIRLRPPSRRDVGIVAAAGTGIGLVAVAVGMGAGLAVAAGAAGGIAAGAVTWAGGQRGAPLDLNSATSPVTVLARDRRTGIVLAAAFGLVFGLVFGAALLVATTDPFVYAAGDFTARAASWARYGAAWGAAYGIVAAVSCGLTLTAWPSYEVARIWLALQRRLPWAFVSFLDDAHRRGVLRQAGAVYQFRHIELQHRLAARP